MSVSTRLRRAPDGSSGYPSALCDCPCQFADRALGESLDPVPAVDSDRQPLPAPVRYRLPEGFNGVPCVVAERCEVLLIGGS